MLRTQRDYSRLICGEGKRFVVSVRVQTLSAAENSSQRLDGYAHDIVEWLLDGKRNARGLRVEAKLERAFVCRTEAIAHLSCPNPTRCPILRNLLEEIVMSVEEERHPGNEFIHVQTGS